MIKMSATLDNRSLTLAKLLDNLNDCTELYYGKDVHCRCGCGGKYWRRGDRYFTRAINRCYADVENCKFVTVDDSCDYINLSLGDRDNKAWTLYFS